MKRYFILSILLFVAPVDFAICASSYMGFRAEVALFSGATETEENVYDHRFNIVVDDCVMNMAVDINDSGPEVSDSYNPQTPLEPHEPPVVEE